MGIVFVFLGIVAIILWIILYLIDDCHVSNNFDAYSTFPFSKKNINTKQAKVNVGQIQQMYRIAPDKWTFDEKFCTYHPTGNEPIVFHFTTRKSLRDYRIWLKQKNKEDEEIKENEIMARVLKEWAYDIQEYRKKNDMQVAEAIKENERIRKNIEKGLDIQDTLWYNKDTKTWEIHKRE